MFRIAFVFLAGCLLVPVFHMPAEAQATEPATDAKASAEAGTPAAATTGFPFDSFPEFSAIMVGSVMVGDQRESHIYRSGNWLRTESAEGIGYFITDLDTLDTYGLSLTGCMHDTHPYFRAFPFSAARPGRKVERVLGGKETVDGHACQMEDVTISGGGLMNPMMLRFWEAEDLHGFPIKIAVLKGPHAVVQYKNVVVGPQDPTLFMHPNSCKMGVPQPPAKIPAAAPRPKTSPAKPTADNSQK